MLAELELPKSWKQLVGATEDFVHVVDIPCFVSVLSLALHSPESNELVILAGSNPKLL